jgi:membrane-associated phospholipid phosphatase
MALIGLLLPFFHKEVPFWPGDFLIHLIFIIGALEIIRFGEKHQKNKILWSIRTFYPVVFYLYGFLEVDHLVRMFFGSYWANDLMINADKVIFGVHPTVWIERYYTPWLDELMSFFFTGYYFFMPVVAFTLFFKGKREETLAAFSVVTFAYLTTYLLFYLFPALNPRMIPWMAEMHNTNYTGYLIASFTRMLQGSDGVVRGGVFPSSHISGAMAWSLVAWRYERKLGLFLIPMVFGVAIATVYLRYHHAVDPIAGLIMGVVCYIVVIAILNKRGEDPKGRVESISKMSQPSVVT